jgi:cyclase
MRLAIVPVLLAFAFPCVAHDMPATPDPLPLDELSKAFNWEFEGAEITAEKIADNFYVLFGVGGNIAVTIGEDGVLIVDDQFPQVMPQIKAKIKALGGDGVDFAVNTHWHFDHAEGNLALGPEGTILVSHINSRDMMQDDHIIDLVSVAYDQKAYPAAAWADVTFDDTMQIHMNGERIDLMHFGAAHTTGDTAVIFRGTNAVHLGDVYNNAGFPFIDAGNGGSIDGIIAFCSATLAEIDKDTVVIPGYGPIATYQDLADYIDLLTTIRSRMVNLISRGATLEQIQAAGVTKEWEDWGGDPTLLINRAYLGLTHKYLGSE